MLKGLKRGTLYLSLGLAMVFYGCEKQDFSNLNGDKKPQGKNHNQQYKISSDNTDDYESFGQDHLNTLDHLASQSHFPNSSDSEIFNTVSAYLDNTLTGTNQLSLNDAESNFNSLYSDVSSKTELINLAISHFSGYCKDNSDYSEDAWHYIDTLSVLYTNFNKESSFINKVESLKEAVNEDNALSDDQRATLLAGYETAMHSLTYWNNARSDNTHNWHETFHEGTLTKSDEEALMLRLSIASSMAFFNVTENLNEADHTISDVLASGAIQAAFNPGPPLIDTDNF